MTILKRIKSREQCTESGWQAYNYLLKEPLSAEQIRAMRPLGSLLFLDSLRQPFFKIESHYYIIKGVQGNDFFRIAIHSAHTDELESLEKHISNI